MEVASRPCLMPSAPPPPPALPKLRRFLVAIAVASALSACDRFPRDPERTLEGARGGVIRVGVAPNPPWTIPGGAEPGGVEADLARDFAKSLDAKIKWVAGGESDLLRGLESFELDLVIGGLTDDTEWGKRVGLTRPYLRSATLVGEAPGAPPVTDITGKEVAVREGDPAARRLRAKHAKPVIGADPFAGGPLVAAESWRILARGYRPTRFRLEEQSHVMAVAPGENAFLLRLERFLRPREGDALKALVAAGAP
jgi:polar amino acid transport system substrate-binding protein